MSERDPRRDQSRKRKLVTNASSSNNDDSNNNGNNSEEANVAPEPTPTVRNDSNAEEPRGPNNLNPFENYQRRAYERLVSSVISERNYFHDMQMQRDLAARRAHNEDGDEAPSPRRARRNDFRSSVQPDILLSRADSPEEEFLQPRTFYNTPPIIMPAGSVNEVNVADLENLNSPNNSIFNNQRRRRPSVLPDFDLSEIMNDPMPGTSNSSLYMNPIFGRNRHNDVPIDEPSGLVPLPLTSQLQTNTVSTQRNSQPGDQTSPTGHGTYYQVNFFTNEGSTRAAQTRAPTNTQGRLTDDELRHMLENGQDYFITIDNRCPRHRADRRNSRNRVDTILATNSAAPVNGRGQRGRTAQRGRSQPRSTNSAASSFGHRLYFLDERLNPVEVPDNLNMRQYVADPLYPGQILNLPLRVTRNGTGSARSGRTRSRVSSGTTGTTLPIQHDYWNRSLHNDSHGGRNERQASALVQAGASGAVNRRANNALVLSSRSNMIGFCPICKRRLNKRVVASTYCGHLFCLVCIKRAIILCGKRCPKCRQELRGQCFHRVYF